LIYQQAFLDTAHFPIQLARAVFASLLASAIWEYHQRTRFSVSQLVGRAPSRLDTFLGFRQGRASSYGRRFALIIAAVLAMAWLVTERIGKDAAAEAKEEIRQKASICAESLDARRFQSLRGAPEDLAQPDYLWLRQRLCPLNGVSPDIRVFYTMFLQDGNVVFAVDSLPLSDKLHAEPGVVYRRPPAELLAAFLNGQSVAAGPYKDEWGTFISGFAVIRDPATHQIIAALGVDIDAANWRKSIARHRLVPILITLLIAMLLVMFFVIRQRLLETAQRIEVNEQRLAEAQEIAHIGNWSLDRQTGAFSWSDEMARICGCSPLRPAVYEEFLDRLVPEDRIAVEAALHQAGTAGTGIDLQVRLVQPGGAVRQAILRGQAKVDDLGEIFQLVGMLQDITEFRQAEERIRASEMKLNAITMFAKDGIVMMDNDGIIVFWNPAAEAVFGYAAAEVIGKNLHGLLTPRRYHPAHDQAFPVWRQAGTGNAIGKTLELMAIRKGGEEFPFELSLSSVKVDGRWMAVGVVRDITDRKRQEDERRRHQEILEELVAQRTQELAGALRRAETANLAKSAFLANMSHELRTPLNAVLGLAQTMQADPQVAAQHKDNLAIILVSGEHLLKLINDVLDITRLEAGKVNLDLQEIQLNALLDEVAESMQPQAADKGLSWTMERAPGLPDCLRTDPLKLRQILTNLIENAIKFTPVGNVSVRIGMQAGAAASRLVIEVQDTGIGIAKPDLDRLFRPFEQVSQNALNEGTGVGLAITRSLIELLGGTITVASELGRGSLFRVILPMATCASGGRVAADSAAPAATPPAPAAPHRQPTTADLQCLPAHTLETLYRLSSEMDYYELLACLNSPSPLTPEARQALVAIINAYRFDLLQKLIEPLVKPAGSAETV
jgi:PAS domain S-box-containing protein